MSFLNEYLEITGICFEDPVDKIIKDRSDGSTPGTGAPGTPGSPGGAIGGSTLNILPPGVAAKITVKPSDPNKVIINGKEMTRAEAAQLAAANPALKQELDKAINEWASFTKAETSNQTGTENERYNTTATENSITSGSRTQTGSQRKYIDIPTPEEFMDDFQNGFATHVKAMRKSGGLSLNQARWLLDNPDMFFDEYIGELGTRAARGEQIFEPTRFDPSTNYMGTRAGDYSDSNTVSKTQKSAIEDAVTSGVRESEFARSGTEQINGQSGSLTQGIPQAGNRTAGGPPGSPFDTAKNVGSVNFQGWQKSFNNQTVQNVEQWRPLVEKYFAPGDVEKALFVIAAESGGQPNIKNAEGSGATGLFQIMPMHGMSNPTNPEAAIRWAADRVYRTRGDWGDWGEGVTHQGKPFGALGVTAPSLGIGVGPSAPGSQAGPPGYFPQGGGTGGGSVPGRRNAGEIEDAMTAQEQYLVGMQPDAPRRPGAPLPGSPGAGAGGGPGYNLNPYSLENKNSSTLWGTNLNQSNNTTFNRSGKTNRTSNDQASYADSNRMDEALYSRPKMTYVKSLSPTEFLGAKYPASSLAIIYEGQKGSKRASVMPAYGTTTTRRS